MTTGKPSVTTTKPAITTGKPSITTNKPSVTTGKPAASPLTKYTNVVSPSDLNRVNINKNSNNTNININNTNISNTNINNLPGWRRPPAIGDYTTLISKSYSKTYWQECGIKCDFGCRYDGFDHCHWYARSWNAKCGCWMFYDAGCSSWYYWCKPDNCYYPTCHCPYDNYTCSLTGDTDTTDDTTITDDTTTDATTDTTTTDTTETETEEGKLELPPLPEECVKK
ncbi:MAG: hypothetical protein QM703_24345 [Gemmatales bacterium]